jgi:hypothetical protein
LELADLSASTRHDTNHSLAQTRLQTGVENDEVGDGRATNLRNRSGLYRTPIKANETATEQCVDGNIGKNVRYGGELRFPYGSCRRVP